MIIDICPVPKPRMVRSDKWKKRECVVKYFDFANELRRLMPPYPKNATRLSIFFTIPMSRSWTKKKKAEMLGKPHRQKPDLSNLIKAVEDILFKDDSGISSYGGMDKVWGESGEINILEITR